MEASDIAAAGSCQRSGRTFVPVYDLGGSLARIDGGSGRVCRTASGHRHRRGAWRL